MSVLVFVVDLSETKELQGMTSEEMHTLVHNARVQLDRHRSADDLAEETRRVAGIICCWGGGSVGAVGGWCGHVFGIALLLV